MTALERAVEAVRGIGANSEDEARAMVRAALLAVRDDPSDEMLRAALSIDRPAMYRTHLRHPASGPSTAAETERHIERERKRWRAGIDALLAQA